MNILSFGIALDSPNEMTWYIETKTLIDISLGMKIYIPLVAINSVTAVHCEQFAVKNSVKLAFFDAASVSIGASAVMLVVGAIREIFGSGYLAGVKLDLPIIFKGMSMPFGCLILLGFLAAGLKAFLSYRYLGDEEESAENETVTEETESETTEVELFEEFWNEQPEEVEIFEEKTQPQTAEEIKNSANEDIEDFFRSLGIDYFEKGDKQ